MSDLRPVVGGVIIGPWMDVQPQDAGSTIDALLEAYELPRGHFLRLYRAGTWPPRLTREASHG